MEFQVEGTLMSRPKTIWIVETLRAEQSRYTEALIAEQPGQTEVLILMMPNAQEIK
jgi:hypothetical protein